MMSWDPKPKNRIREKGDGPLASAGPGNAFTLVETLLAISLMALGVLAGAYLIYRNLDSTALRAGGQRLLNMARYGRLMATEHHQVCHLHINLDTGDYWLTATPAQGPVTEEMRTEKPATTEEVVSNVLIKPQNLGENLRFARSRLGDDLPATKGTTTITFHYEGRAQPALIELASRRETLTMVIHPVTARAALHAGSWDELDEKLTYWHGASRDVFPQAQ